MANSLDVWLVWWRKIVYAVLHIIWFSQAQLLCIFLNIFIHQFSTLSNICWICCIINSGPVSLIFFTSLSFCESLLSMFSSVHVSACTFPMAVKRSLCPFLLCIPLLSLFSLFLKLNMISLSPTSAGRSVPEIISVPIKVCQTWHLECPAGGLILLWLGQNCDNYQSPYTPACTLWRSSNMYKCHANVPTGIPYVPVIYKVF